jgi:hypothetical protein
MTRLETNWYLVYSYTWFKDKLTGVYPDRWRSLRRTKIRGSGKI